MAAGRLVCKVAPKCAAAREISALAQGAQRCCSDYASGIRSAEMRAKRPQASRGPGVDVLRFGKPVCETTLDRWRRVATFELGAVSCRVKWIGNDYGTALWQLLVLQAPAQFQGAQRVAGVAPGARILLRADGEAQVKAVLGLIDGIEALGIDPRAVAVTYWRTVGNRLAARQPLPHYTTQRHAAHLAREALR